MLNILVFADATATESLSGSPGFQFIAHSAGATPIDEAVAKNLQHTVPAGLPADDWANHPETCTYTHKDGRLYLSRGLSTGATLGGRPGNQLTVTVLTSDPFDILPQRPAQLFSSTAWSFARPTTQDLPAWETPVDISEDFDITGLHSLVVDDPWAKKILPIALTMLEQTQAQNRTRLFIRHPDQTLVMRWIALLSRFLDSHSALAFEFRVFTDDPMRSNTHVVGVHPALAPDLTVDAATPGINLIDLELRALTALEPSESAVRYAQWFVAGDPYEALESIEVGRRWARFMDPSIASAAAELATMESTRGKVTTSTLRTSLVAITALASAGQTDELETYGDELADLAASCPPTGADDLLATSAAMWASSAAGDAELAQSLALAALEWTAAEPTLLGALVVAPRSEQLTWHGEEARAHAAGLLATILTTTQPAMLPAAFSLAKALDTGLGADTVAAPMSALVARWSADPALTAQAPGWMHYEALVRQLSASLNARLTTADPEALRSVVAGSWDWLAPRPWRIDPELPLSRWFALREVRTTDAARRSDVIIQAQSSLPSSAWRDLLATSAGLDPDEVVGWIKSHGAVDPRLSLEIERILGDLSHFPAWRRAGGAKVLHEVGKLGAAMPEGLRRYVASQAAILPLFSQAATDKDVTPNSSLRTIVRRYPAQLNGLWGDWVANAVIISADTRASTALADGPGRPGVLESVQSALEGELRKATPRAMTIAVRLLDPDLGDGWAAAARGALSAVWDDKKEEAVRELLLDSVDGRLSANENARLDQFLESQSKGRLARNVLRGAKSIFGNKDS